MDYRLHGDEAERALRAFDVAAERLDPFDFVPSEGATARIATLGPFYLRPAEWTAMAASSDVEHVVLVNLNTNGEVFRENCWGVEVGDYPFEKLKHDERWNGIGQSAVASPDGTWVLVISNEGHGVISGQSEFVSKLAKRLRGDKDPLFDLVERIFIGRPEKADADARLLEMVSRLYGWEKARRVINELGIDPHLLGNAPEDRSGGTA